MKARYLRSPIRAVKAAKAILKLRLSMWRFARHGERRFRNDPRFNLENVTDGFASRIDHSNDDRRIVERISRAYKSAVRQMERSCGMYDGSEKWQQVRQQKLAPVIRALLVRDVDALVRMYGNFYRDACSSGILGAPNGLAKAYFSGKIKDLYRRFYLSHVLYRLDYWKSQISGQFVLQDLAGPGVGNPFGVVIDGTHISVGSEYAHYCSDRVGGMLEREDATVAEFGGGFGGMAYYLLRDRKRVTYIGFDVPESVALTSYYLMKAFPKLRFLLYGEEELTQEAIDRANVVLMPAFEMGRMPAGSVNVFFSSHALSDLSQKATAEIVRDIARMTNDGFLYIGNENAGQTISDLICNEHNSFKLTGMRMSGWSSFKVSGAGVGGEAGLTASTAFERSYSRCSEPESELFATPIRTEVCEETLDASS